MPRLYLKLWCDAAPNCITDDKLLGLDIIYEEQLPSHSCDAVTDGQPSSKETGPKPKGTSSASSIDNVLGRSEQK